MSVTAPPTAIFGEHDEKTIEQLETCASFGDVAAAALMADGHFGYSQPIGGVVAYRNQISPSGVGYDIACGNKAVRTKLTWGDIQKDLPRLADAIFSKLEFGVGRVNDDPAAAEHPIFDDRSRFLCIPDADKAKWQGLIDKARNQLGTIGSGNHYVDVFVEQDIEIGLGVAARAFTDASPIWIGVHFGSRGFGHTTATGFLNMAHGVGFFDRAARGELPQDEPTILSLESDLGLYYVEAMKLAGDYAYAGRDHVVQRVLDILGTEADYEVHAHHNFGWLESHGGEDLWVVRKGATPLWPGEESFIGGSMCDIAVIARGANATVQTEPLTRKLTAGELESNVARVLIPGTPSPEQRFSLMSTVHGAGRVMGRMEAKGKKCNACKNTTKYPGCPICEKCGGSGMSREGKVTPEMMREVVEGYAPLELRGAGLDESPFVYRKLRDVLDVHEATTEVLHTLRPVIVCMAGANEFDPFKD